MPATLYTLGYEGLSLDVFLGRLLAADVTRLIDVRELPLSRRHGFSKTALSEALAARGIEYIHLRPLGNPKKNRDRYRQGDTAGGARAYREHLHNGSYGALQDLAQSLDDRVSCLLCFERDHETCHRAVIVESLGELRPDVSVEHL